MILADSNVNAIVITVSVVAGVVVLAALFIVLYFTVISKNRYKKQIKELEKKFSFLDALLLGQDSQYIHRLEIISRTNLLYVDKYETFSKRFKEIYENDDKFASQLIKQLLTLINNGKYKNIKVSILDAKKAVNVFEERVNALDADLYEVIKLEEFARSQVLKLKEDYRHVKQDYYSNAADLEYVSGSFNKVFEKLDAEFAKIEEYIESAEYEEANAIIPVISKVNEALADAIVNLPNLVGLVTSIIPNKISELSLRYREVEKQGLPLFHLTFKQKIDSFHKRLKQQEDQLKNLKSSGVKQECDLILSEIAQIYSALDEEIEAKDSFLKENKDVYFKTAELEKSFLKICSLLPEVNKIYLIEDSQSAKLEELRNNINSLGSAKRSLDGFIHSGTKQPYSLLKSKLNDLKDNYEKCNVGLLEFKTYLESLKSSAEEAYNMVYNYYFRAKEVERLVREFGIKQLIDKYNESLNQVFEAINTVNALIKKQPIDIIAVNQNVENLKAIANSLFDEVESKSREQKLAESAIVYANRDRNHQNDVHQQLSILENCFYEGDFLKVYHDANAIYSHSHVEEDNGSR